MALLAERAVADWKSKFQLPVMGTECTEAGSGWEVDPIGSPPAGFIIHCIIWLLDQGFLLGRILSFRSRALAKSWGRIYLSQSQKGN